MQHIQRSLFAIVAIALFSMTAASVLAEGNKTLGAGFDYWQTLGSGATSYSFANDPLPADFFCRGSQPFKGEVAFEGKPLQTQPAKKLGNTDTVIERLEDVQFNKEGFGTTKIVVRALNLVSRDPIQTSCGDWNVQAELAGRQPSTEMSLLLSNTCNDTGVFTADLDLNVRLNFINTTSGATLSVVRGVSLPTFSDEPFAIHNQANRCRYSLFPSNESVYLEKQKLWLSAKDAFAPGCWCSCETNECLPILPEHEGPDEDHFTVPPCDFFGETCFNDIDHLRRELQALERSKTIDEDVETALYKLISPKF